MNQREAIELVARREFSEGFRSRAWRAALGIQMLVVAGIAIVSIVTSGGSGIHTRRLAIAGPKATAIAAKARGEAKGYGIKLEVEDATSAAVAREKVADEDADAALGNAGGGLATVGTFLPPMAPMVVPGRAAQGELPAAELVISLLLMLAAIAVVVVVAARIYDRSVLRFGTPMKLREAIKLAVQRG